MADFPNFCGASDTTRSRWINAERTVNLYRETNRDGAKGRAALYGTPGRALFSTLPDTPVRGLWAGDHIAYAVGGSSFYSVSTIGTATLLGTLNAATTPAGIIPNGNQLLIVSGDEIFCDSGLGPVSVLTDGYVDATFLDGYYLALRQPTLTNGISRDEIWVSGLYDGTTWDPVDIQSRNTMPDRVMRSVAYRNQLWLFGQRSFEAWYNSGNADYPFERVQGSQTEMGVYPWTIGVTDEALLMLGSSPRGANRVYMMTGYTAVPVSTPAVEASIRDLSAVLTPKAWTYQEDGHSFYVLQAFGSTQPSWVYDMTEKCWHERGVWNSGTASFDGDGAAFHAALYTGNHLIGDSDSGKIWIQSNRYGTYDGFTGDPIVRYRRAPHISDGVKTICFPRFTLDIETGNAIGGETPTAELHWSNDGARTFNAYRSASLGAANARGKRVEWRRLGSIRAGDGPVRTFGVKLSAKSEIAISGADLELA